jgi:hypothetical protein
MNYGRIFIEKFIQLSYILPVPRSNGLKAMINPTVGAPSSPVPESEKSARAIEIVTGKEDSSTMDSMVDMADAIFDHNPRNVKQFVNAFRLQAFIANETGLFGSTRVTRNAGKPLTLQQLGKFVALCMRWPEFVEAASSDHTLVAEIEQWLRTGSNSSLTGLPDRLAVWYYGYAGLTTLLGFGMPNEDFLLAGVDFGVLTEIAPARAKSAFVQQPSSPSEPDHSFEEYNKSEFGQRPA